MKELIKKKDFLFSLSILGFFFFIGIFADFLASNLPLFLWENKTPYSLPKSPWFSYYILGEERLSRYPFRKWAEEGKIQAIFPLVPYSPYEENLEEILSPPSFSRFGHYMGTDRIGRDIASRMIHGAKNSLLISSIAVLISLIIGILIGAIAGYWGGWVDIFLSRLIEIVITFPTLILIMAVLALLKPSLLNIMVVLGLTGGPGIARVIRGEFLKRKNEEFVFVARSLGASHTRIIFFHILPHSLGPILVMGAFGMASAVLYESALSFLGIGVQPPEPSWGEILSESREYMDIAWWLMFFPGVSIFLVVLAYNLLGDSIQEYLQPKEKWV